MRRRTETTQVCLLAYEVISVVLLLAEILPILWRRRDYWQPQYLPVRSSAARSAVVYGREQRLDTSVGSSPITRAIEGDQSDLEVSALSRVSKQSQQAVAVGRPGAST